MLTAALSPALYFLVFRKIQEDEERFRQLNASAQDAIVIANKQGRITDWNFTAQRMFQYSREEAVGQQMHQLIAPLRYRDDAAHGFARFEESGEGPLIGKTIEISALRKDGSEFPIELSISAVKVKGHWHAIGIVRDITQRKQAEEELRLRAQLLDSTLDSIFMHDFDGNFVYMNEAAWKTRGYTRDELMGMNLHVLDTPEYEKLIESRMRDLMEKGQSLFESAHRCKDGSVMPIEISARIIESGGRKLILTTVRDITERKQAEQRKYLEEACLKASLRLNNMIGADEKTVLDFIMEEGLRIMDSRYSFIGWINEDASVMTIHSWSSEVMKTCAVEQPPIQFPIDKAGIWAEPVRNRKAIIINDYAQPHPQKHGYPPGHVEIRRYLGVPVFDGDRVAMVAAVANKNQEYDESDATALSSIMTDAWRVIQRNRAEQVLRESEERFYHLFENMSNGVAVYQPDTACEVFTFKTVNRALERIERVKREEVLGRSVEDVFPGVRAFGLLEVFQRVCRSGEAEHIPPAFYQDERIAGWRENYVYRLDSDEIVAVYDDVTERKQAEDKLRGSEERYRSLFENMLEGYAYCKMLFEHGTPLDFIYLGVNDAFEKKTGLKDVVGKKVTEVIPGIRKSNPELFEIYGRVALTGKPEKFETYIDVLGIWLSITAYSSEKEYFIAIFDNITERKKADTELQKMLKTANQSRQVMLGVIEDQKRAEESLRHLNAELENKVLARTADLNKARLEAEQANKAKSEFLATMSHEIRTPMNGVIGMVDVLRQSSLKGPQVEMVNIIHDSAFSLLTVINDILDFSKIEAGKLQIDSVPMSIADVVEVTCETLDRMALKKEVELTLFTEPAIPAAVMGDAGRLRQILVNLANNAIKFSSGQNRPGKVSVRALLAESTPEQVTLEFRVADNGIGIDEATLARLFTAFTQADTSTTRTYGGTGLGLVISSQLASLMGGKIAVQSKPGKGSLFSVRIPFTLPPEQPAADEASSLIAELPCLLMDGQNGMADDLAAYLVHAGAVVERATNLAAARQWIAGRPPGLCIVVIDTAGSNPPLATSLLDELRAAVRTQPNLDIRFVTIGRGQRREPRLWDHDLVSVDGNALTRRILLKTVAIAAGRAKQLGREALPGDVKATLTPLSREEARRRGNLILIAEDNEINQKVILQQLALLGRTADIASNGREALELWRSGDYAMLFADLHMPEMDGYELTAAIRAAETGKTHKPIIAFTANVLKGEAERCLAIGMDDYLSKPVQLVNLKAMLEKWMPVAVSPPAETTSTTNSSLEPVQSLPPVRGKARMGVAQRESQASTPSLTLPLQGGELARGQNVAVDVNVLKALVGDDDAMIREFLHDFHLSAAKIAAELRTACAAGQATAAGALAHKLKSSSRSVGALALGDLCAEMEQAGKASDAETLAALLPKFEQELAGVERFLEGY